MISENVEAEVDVKNLCFSYVKGDENTLSNITLSAEKGKFTVIMGHTGAGKTTLLMCLNGIIPQLLNGSLTGDISVSGLNALQYRVQTLSKSVGLVLQDAETQILGRTVSEDVAFGPRNYLVPREEILERINEALSRVRLNGYESRSTDNLSGGEKQRLAIAGVLAMKPKILVLDEPTSELDPLGRDEIYTTIENLSKESEITIIAVEHASQDILQRADHLIVLSQGAVSWRGNPRDFFKSSALVEENGIKPIPVGIVGNRLCERGLIPPERIPLSVDEAFDTVTDLLSGRQIIMTSEAPSVRPKETQSNLVSIKNLGHVYENGKTALHEVNLDVREGDFLALIGQNGAGKTTLAKHFNSLLKPTQGSVHVCGINVGESEPEELASHIGYVFQNPDHQIFSQSVWKEVAFGLKNIGLPENEMRSRIERVLNFTHLWNLRDEHPFSLGKGERQMIAVASILALEPKILVVDEPTTGLDWRGIRRIMDLIKTLHDNGTTIIMITHDMDLVAHYATRTVVMRHGAVLLDGETRDVLADTEKLRDAYVTPPQIVDFSLRLKPFGLNRIILDEKELGDIIANSVQEESHNV